MQNKAYSYQCMNMPIQFIIDLTIYLTITTLTSVSLPTLSITFKVIFDFPFACIFPSFTSGLVIVNVGFIVSQRNFPPKLTIISPSRSSALILTVLNPCFNFKL